MMEKKWIDNPSYW